jgi:hypothetical protein
MGQEACGFNAVSSFGAMLSIHPVVKRMASSSPYRPQRRERRFLRIADAGDAADLHASVGTGHLEGLEWIAFSATR